MASALAGALLFASRENNKSIKLEVPEVTPEKQQALTEQAQQLNTTTTLIEPRFTGRNINGRQWDIRAKKATRTGQLAEDEITLNYVTAIVDTATIEPLKFTAIRGDYLNQQSILKLTGNVEVNGYGILLTAPKLTADLDKNTLKAEPKVTLTGTWHGWQGHFAAPHLTLQNPGPTLTLTGGVKGRFEFKKEAAAL
ncbi:MAG: LPS export ABC transporter periplasmic protein LptC [Alphaproteobacteria bacterium]|nr:LPS export ABC transporter periplasmic protein LptC [Alphaproteobacteria bacterium]